MSSAERLCDMLKNPGNEICADCQIPGPEWAVSNIGIFICNLCAGYHRNMDRRISILKTLTLDQWSEEELQIMEKTGNKKANEYYLQHLPMCYRQPTYQDAEVLREQWICAKYERKEFISKQRQSYLSGERDGWLWKRGKKDKTFKRRRFVLSELEGTLKYYVKEEAKEPKATLRLGLINVIIVPEKIGKNNSMQINHDSNSQTRSLFVYADNGKDFVEWYTALRSAKLNLLAIAHPNASPQELCSQIFKEPLKQGWLMKSGPKPSDAFRKRWMILERQKLLYYEDPLDAFPKGVVLLGNKDKGYEVLEGSGKTAFGFRLITPERNYYFEAPSKEEQDHWLFLLNDVIKTCW